LAVLFITFVIAVTPARSLFAATPHWQAVQTQIRTFTGTIIRNGDQFVLNDAKAHTFYQLDDQTTAGKFENKKVTISGTLDVVKDIIRIQSIAEASA